MIEVVHLNILKVSLFVSSLFELRRLPRYSFRKFSSSRQSAAWKHLSNRLARCFSFEQFARSTTVRRRPYLGGFICMLTITLTL